MSSYYTLVLLRHMGIGGLTLGALVTEAATDGLTTEAGVQMVTEAG